MLTSGTLLQNRYQIVKLLGQGGMGAVYQAHALALGGKFVAIKENIGGDATQFKQEVVILANLSHPNLPRVLDYFIEANGAQYLVMDYIEGEDLDALTQRHGVFAEAQVLAWLNQILDAVGYLHTHGVIHRDIKPANIKITPTGQAVLVDFGIAKVFQDGWSTLTGAKAGTPGFAAPEQYRGGTDQRSDIYSLGATLYALLTGSAPPDAKSLESGSASLTPPRMLITGISYQTERVILQAMAVQPSARFQTASEMRYALASPFIAPTVTIPASASVATMPATRAPRKRWIMPILATMILCFVSSLAGIGGWQLANTWSTTLTERVALAETTTPTVELVFTVVTNTAVLPTVTLTAPPPVSPTMMPTPTRTRTITSTLSATRTPTPLRTPTVTPVPSAQKKLDSSKDGIFIIDLTSGAQIKIPSIDGIAASAAWSPNGDKVLVSWLKVAAVKQSNGQYVCGYSWKYGPQGIYFGPDYCNHAPTYLSGTYGGGLKLVSLNGEAIADLAKGSPEPHFVGDPQINYTDAIWSPDGNRMAVLYKQADGNRCPFIGSANATGLRKLGNCEADDHPRFWSVDGKWLITWSERSAKLSAYEVDGSRRMEIEQLGKLPVYDQRYFPWKVTDLPACKGDTGFWSCQ